MDIPETLERRSFGLDGVEVRSHGGAFHFSGHAAVFNTPSADLGGYTQVVESRAFDRALASSQDVLFTVNHDENKLLARTSSGTLKLAKDAKGLAVEAVLPDTSYARDMVTLIERRDLDGMSFVFKPAPGGHSMNFKDGKRQRSLTDLNLFDVSVVTMPAYGSTNVDLEFRNLYGALMEMRSGRKISTSSREQIQQAIEVLSGLLAEEAAPPPSARSLRLDFLERYA